MNTFFEVEAEKLKIKVGIYTGTSTISQIEY